MRDVIAADYALILVISVVCVILVSRQKPSKEQQLMQMLISFMGITMAGYYFRIEADTLEQLVTAQKIIFLGGCNTYFLMLSFYLRYCHIRFNHKVKNVLVGICVGTTAVAFTFDKHKLFYSSFHMVEKDGFYVLEKAYGPLYLFYLAEILLYCIAMMVIAVQDFRGNRKKRNLQLLQLLLVAVCPIGIYLVEKIRDTAYSLVPFGMAIGLCLMLYLMYFQKIYDLQNMAQEYTFTSINAGVVVVDAENKYKSSNMLAMSMFPELKNAAPDEDMRIVSERLIKFLEGKKEDVAYGGKIYGVDVRKIEQQGSVMGKVIWLSDVTNQRKYFKFQKNYQKQLEVEVNRKTRALRSMQEEIILSFASVIESRDQVTGGHVMRTSGYVNILVNSMKGRSEYSELKNDSYAKHVCLAAPLHDIGKIGIPDAVLNKMGKFEPEEFEIMKGHTSIGSEILDRTLSSLEDKEYYELAKTMAGCHHERWDGTGYPNGMKGEEIPVCARIMAVADVFDALTSKRPYKDEFSMGEAFSIIKDGRGTQFDPKIVDAFMEAQEQIVKFHDENKMANAG